MKKNGFSLPELMVSSAIGVIVALGMSTVFIFSVTQFQIMIEKSQTEENALLLSFYSRVFLSQADDLSIAGNIKTAASPLNGTGADECDSTNLPLAPPPALPATHPCGADIDGSEGYIDYDYDYQTAPQNNESLFGSVGQKEGGYSAFAVFNREWGTDDSNKIATGIFVRDTGSTDMSVEDTERRSATVFFTLNSSAGFVGPANAQIKFDRVHRYEVQKVPIVTGGTVNPADVNSYCLAIEIEPRPSFSDTDIQDAMDAYPTHCIPPPGQDVGAAVGAGTWVVDSDGILGEPTLVTSTTPRHAFKVKTVSMHIVTRHYRTINRNAWDYRTLASDTSANFLAPFKDVDMTVKISIKNNVLGTSVTSGTTRDERVHGGLYFFRPLFPRF